VIESSVELKVVVRNLRILEETLRSLREELSVKNPSLLEVISKAYVRRIALLQTEIAQYFAANPAEVSLILPPVELAIAAVPPTPTPTPG
jgi:hypothetical protein